MSQEWLAHNFTHLFPYVLHVLLVYLTSFLSLLPCLSQLPVFIVLLRSIQQGLCSGQGQGKRLHKQVRVERCDKCIAQLEACRHLELLSTCTVAATRNACAHLKERERNHFKEAHLRCASARLLPIKQGSNRKICCSLLVALPPELFFQAAQPPEGSGPDMKG